MTLPRLKPSLRRPKRVKVKRVFQKQRTWIRKRDCIATLTPYPEKLVSNPCDGRIEAAHVRSETDGGMALKPHDRWLVSACLKHHEQQTVRGEKWFEDYWGLDMKALAREFADKSPYARELAE